MRRRSRSPGTTTPGLADQRDGVLFSALTLLNAERDFGYRMEGSLNSVVRGGDQQDDIRENAATLSLLGLLPSGADVTVTGTADRTYGRSDSEAGGTVTARLEQPLLRGFGYEASHEGLTDAQRQALYDVRSYDLARQDLAVRVLRDYYGIVSQKQVVKNRQSTLTQFEFLKRRSEALFALDRASEIDKFRADREFLSAQNDLVDARQELEARIDRFKSLLGVDSDQQFGVADEVPEVEEPEGLDLQRYIEMALRSRLD